MSDWRTEGGRVAAVGECMAEVRLSAGAGGQAGAALDATIGFGGDTLNFAIYLARQGVAVDYVTALGDDPLSEWMLAAWRKERVGCDFVRRQADAATGLYLIDVDAAGERTFHYWRAGSPASRLLDDAARAQRLFAKLAEHAWLYLSGITLAIYTPQARDWLLDCASAYRRAGGKVAFDGNFRPRLWPDAAAAKSAYERMYRLTDLALSTFDDEQQVFGDATVDAAVERLRAWGVPEIVLKRGASGCTVAAGARRLDVPAVPVARAVDTTAAGDSFNAQNGCAAWHKPKACGHHRRRGLVQRRLSRGANRRRSGCRGGDPRRRDRREGCATPGCDHSGLRVANVGGAAALVRLERSR